MTTPLIVIRHGATRLNEESGDSGSSECLRGHLDIPLAPEGKDEAARAGEKLRKLHFDVLLSSDLSRARDTAKIVSAKTGVPLSGVTKGLRPWDVGDYAGRPVPNCLEMLHDYAKNKPSTALKGGESFDDFRDRFLDCLDDIRRKYTGKTVAIVCHARNERVLEGWRRAGGGADEEIDPDALLMKGIAPGEFRTDIKLGKGSKSDDVAPSKKAQSKPAPSKPAQPWSSAPIEPRAGGPQKDLFSYSVGGKHDGMGKTGNELDLKPAVPLRKRSQSWAATILADLVRGK
jgi:probable phosphoglycerate mutase